MIILIDQNCIYFQLKYASSCTGVVIIDDHPEVTVVEDSQSNLNNDGFTEVVSKKQQKRLQDEERRKKEEQTVQVKDQTSSFFVNRYLYKL